MVYITIALFCAAGLFLTLLEDRWRVWTTLIGTACTYLLALGAAVVLRRTLEAPAADHVPYAVGVLFFLIASFLLSVNNPLQKIFVALLCLCNFAFLQFFLPLLLGVLPFSTAGAFAGVFSVLAYCLFSLLTGLCLYRPLHSFADRGISGFMAGVCLLALWLYILCLGQLDFLFRTNIFAARLLMAVLLYGFLVFCFRSLYQAGRFRQKSVNERAQSRLLEMEAADFSDMLTAIREVRSAQKAGEYALDTVSVLLSDGWADKVPQYIAAAKENAARNPILTHYHDDPYLDAVLATKAAFAAQNHISFECNAVTGSTPLKLTEICVITNEVLTRACREAAEFQGDRKLRFTLFPAGDSLSFEAVYSSLPKEREPFSLKGKKFSDVLFWLLEDPSEEDDLHGLENTREILGRYSGKLTVSNASTETILQASLRF